MTSLSWPLSFGITIQPGSATKKSPIRSPSLFTFCHRAKDDRLRVRGPERSPYRPGIIATFFDLEALCDLFRIGLPAFRDSCANWIKDFQSAHGAKQ